MRRARVWIIVGVALVAVIAVALAALPAVVRRVAISQITTATGRSAAIDDVALNLFSRRLAITGFRLADRDGGAPLAEFQRLEARFRLLPLLRGRLYLEAASLHGPVVRVVRTRPESFNVSDLLERFLRGEPAAEPFHATLDHFALIDGAVTFEDRALSSPRTWELRGLKLDLRDLATVTDAARGTAAASFTLAGAPVAVTADHIRVRPAHARATITLTGLDLGGLVVYIPADAAIRLDGGRFSTRLELQYDASTGVRAGGDATATDLVLGRRGQTEPFVTTPQLQMTSRDVTYKNGVITAGQLELAGDPSVLDAMVSPSQRFDLSGVRLTVEDASYPTRAPARVTLVAGLPSGGRLDTRGALEMFPVAADLKVSVADVDLTLLRPYLPPDAPVTLGRGRLRADLQVQRDRHTDLRVNGTARVSEGVLHRRGQSVPFASHPVLDIAMSDLTLQGSDLAVKRLELAGEPTIVDASLSPPQRFELKPLRAAIENATWPSRGPASVRVTAAVVDGGSASIQGTVDPGTLGGDVRVLGRDLDLTRVRPYLPANLAVTLERGQLQIALRLRHDPATGTRIAGDGTLADVALQRRDDREPFLTAPHLALTVRDLVARAGTVTIEKATLAGDPTVVDETLSPPARLVVPSIQLAVEKITWPGRAPARVQLAAKLPDSGALTLSGTAEIAARWADVHLVLEDAALAPYQRHLRLPAPITGRVNADLELNASLADALAVKATGIATVDKLAVGPAEGPPITVERAAATGIDVTWPARISIERVIVAKPFALIEREQSGEFPLRAMLTPAEVAAPAAATPASHGAPAGEPRPAAQTALRIDDLQVIDGDARFIDRTTTPFYSEEMSRLTVTVRGLSNAPGERAQVSLQALVGANAALDLHGEVAPFGEPFFLDVAGELREFAIPRVNPYLQRILDWIVRTGRVTTRVHYRVVGDQLEATNDIVVERLSVERAPQAAEADQRVGLPLGLAVALMKDTHGDIKVSVPVSGRLSAPEFSFGGVIREALKNVVTKVVTAPFRAIGKIFQKDDDVEAVTIDPIEFDAGSAVITPEMEKQLQRVADFLRASPSVKLTLAAVVGARDVLSLKTQEVTARIQAVQREQRLANFAEAALHLFRERYPDQTVPKTVDDIVAALRDRASPPTEPARRLAERRLETTRQTILREAGIEPERLITNPATAAVGDPGAGRVEFDLET